MKATTKNIKPSHKFSLENLENLGDVELFGLFYKFIEYKNKNYKTLKSFLRCGILKLHQNTGNNYPNYLIQADPLFKIVKHYGYKGLVIALEYADVDSVLKIDTRFNENLIEYILKSSGNVDEYQKCILLLLEKYGNHLDWLDHNDILLTFYEDADDLEFNKSVIEQLYKYGCTIKSTSIDRCIYVIKNSIEKFGTDSELIDMLYTTSAKHFEEIGQLDEFNEKLSSENYDVVERVTHQIKYLFNKALHLKIF